MLQEATQEPLPFLKDMAITLVDAEENTIRLLMLSSKSTDFTNQLQTEMLLDMTQDKTLKRFYAAWDGGHGASTILLGFDSSCLTKTHDFKLQGELLLLGLRWAVYRRFLDPAG